MLFSLDLLSFSYFSVYAFQRTKSLVNICCIEFANNELYKSETCTMIKSAMNAKYLLFNISDRLHAMYFASKINNRFLIPCTNHLDPVFKVSSKLQNPQYNWL